MFAATFKTILFSLINDDNSGNNDKHLCKLKNSSLLALYLYIYLII